MIEQITDNT